MIVDCMTCPVRGQRCDDCAVTALYSRALDDGASGSTELHLDAAENRVVSMFVGAGLVSARVVSTLHARRESLQPWGVVREVG